MDQGEDDRMIAIMKAGYTDVAAVGARQCSLMGATTSIQT